MSAAALPLPQTGADTCWVTESLSNRLTGAGFLTWGKWVYIWQVLVATLPALHLLLCLLPGNQPGCRFLLWKHSLPQKAIKINSSFCQMGPILPFRTTLMLSFSIPGTWTIQSPHHAVICLFVHGINNSADKLLIFHNPSQGHLELSSETLVTHLLFFIHSPAGHWDCGLCD